jgi:hypothetical protein
MKTLTLDVVDWNGSRHAAIEDVPSDVTAGEIIDNEIREAFALSAGATFHLIYNGEKLNRNQTLEELGVEDNSSLEVAAEVSAG